MSVRRLSIPALGVIALWSGGCVGRLIGEGAEGTLGPKGAYWEEKPAAASKAAAPLAGYQRFELEILNDYGRHVPPELLTRLPAAFARQARRAGLPDVASGRTLVLHVAIIHYETADFHDNVFGPLEQVVARVTLRDKDSAQVLATGNAIGRTGKTVGLGAESKAEGLARALVSWITDYYPRSGGSGSPE